MPRGLPSAEVACRTWIRLVNQFPNIRNNSCVECVIWNWSVLTMIDSSILISWSVLHANLILVLIRQKCLRFPKSWTSNILKFHEYFHQSTSYMYSYFSNNKTSTITCNAKYTLPVWMIMFFILLSVSKRFWIICWIRNYLTKKMFLREFFATNSFLTFS